jgi:hypothetical protein
MEQSVMSALGKPLATLHAPDPEEASRWHKPRPDVLPARIQLVIDFFLEEPAARLLKRTSATTEFLIDSGVGTSLRLTIRPDTVEVRVGPCLLQGGEEPMARDEFVLHACGIIEILQLGTGFYVYSDELVGFDPSGACPECGIEVYEWQEVCVGCETKVQVPRPGEDEFDAHARRVVEVLLRRQMIELTCPRGRKNVERVVSTYFSCSTASAGVLLGIFMEMADIAEVYCDEVELRRVLWRIQ